MNVILTSMGLIAGFALSLYSYNMGQHNPPCMEDEVYAVQIDTNPSHGLTWACENIEEFKASAK